MRDAVKGDLLLCVLKESMGKLTFNAVYANEGFYDTGDRQRPGVMVIGNSGRTEPWYCDAFINLSVIFSEEELEGLRKRILKG